MKEITKADILTELKKPLDTPRGVLSADLLRERLGIQKAHTSDEWLFFYKELTYCIEAGLVKFFNDFDMRDFQSSFQNYIDVNFYLNHLANKLILITPAGELWLNQQGMSKEIQEVKTSVDTMKETTNKSIGRLDRRSLIIGIIIILLTALGIVISYLHL